MKTLLSKISVSLLTFIIVLIPGEASALGNYMVENGTGDPKAIMKNMFEKGQADQLISMADSLLSIKTLPLNEQLLMTHFKTMAMQSLGRYNESLAVSADVLKIEKPDSLLYWDVQFLIGRHDIYNRIGAKGDALATLERAASIISTPRWKNVNKIKADNMYFSVLMSKSVYYQTAGKWDKALSVIENYNPVNLSDPLKLMLEGQKAILYYKVGWIEDAESWFKKVSANPVNNPNKLMAIIYYAEMLNMQGRSQEAASVLDTYVELAKSVNDVEIIRDYLMIRAHVMKDMGREREANQYYNQLLVVDDTLHKVHREALEEILATKISAEKVEELNDSLGFMKRSVTIGIIVSILLLLLMGGIIWISLRHKRSSSEKIKNLISTIDRSDAEYRAKMESLEKDIEVQSTKLQTSVIQLSKLDSGLKTIQEELNTPNKTSDERIAAIRLNILEVARESDNAERYNLLATKESQRLMTRLVDLHPDLTKSELEICCYVAKGLTTKDIATLSGRSTRTVEALKYSLRKKLDITIPTDAYIRNITCGDSE